MSEKGPAELLQEVVEAVGVYPPQAYLFVQQGLSHTAQKIHGKATEEQGAEPDGSRHIGGRELSLGLRELALHQWGLMARTVLARWNITTTLDFGRIVFALVEHDLMQKTDEDRIDDFRGVYDFQTALETEYRIKPAMAPAPPRRAEKPS